MNLKTLFGLFFISINLFAQVVTTNLQYPTENDSIIIYFDATQGTGGLKDFTGDVYAHTGVITNLSKDGSDWKYVMAPWNQNYNELKLTRDNANLYHLVIGNPRKFYSGNHQNLGSIPETEHILKLAFVFRNSNGSKEGKDVGFKDIYVQLYDPGFSVVINTPALNTNFGNADRAPIFIDENATQLISVGTTEKSTKTKSISLFVNDVKKSESFSSTLNFNFVASDYSSWKNNIKIIAEDIAGQRDTAIFVIFKNKTPHDEPLPEGNRIGINYDSNGNIILALFAPYKKNVFLLGDFNSWKVDTLFAMNRYQVTPDSVIWWCRVPFMLVDPHPTEYRYQFLIDGSLRVQDPYSEIILDPGSDSDPELKKVYPDLISYPTGVTEGIVSVLPLTKENYNWTVPNFTRPSKDKLVIYELLIRDFVSTHSYKTLKDTLSYFKKLGVNAIELMPITEFEGNSSWGYNPMMYFAPDKYYGTRTQLKDFIDACHQNGIAVIMDMVLNHSYGSSPMVRMYWDSANNRPAANNPWYNQSSPNPAYSWGYDFNHESSATKYFVDRVTSFWLTEYKVDGFRFDFSKGFTNTPGDGWAYDEPRIKILKRMADKIWSVSPDAYVILEHFTANSEEIILSDYGMMIWGNLNYNYNEAAMGWVNTSDFSNISYKYRGWNNPNLVGYMESHDEERLMYKNIKFGNFIGYNSSNPNEYNPMRDYSGNIIYSIRELPTALDRMKLDASFFLTVPGPKMIWQFGELGYDKSINYPSGTSNDRLTPKPILWEYFSDTDRKKLFDVFAALIRLKKTYPVFTSGNYSLTAAGAVKTLSISDESMSVNIFGNFDVVAHAAEFSSKSISKWYEFFSGDSISVSDAATPINLKPGEYRLYTSVKLPSVGVLVDVQKDDPVQTDFKLSQNYPNPFNPATTIRYSIPNAETKHASSMPVTLKIYDMLGREISTLVNDYKSPGNYEVTFDGSNLASGVYFYVLHSGNFVESKKMILLK
jgi:glycosidase